MDVNEGRWRVGAGAGAGAGDGAGDGNQNKTNSNPQIRAAFMNQFENESNYRAHIQTTGPELWNQTKHQIDVFCMSSGTGATLSGVGRYLKDQSSKEMTAA